MLDWRTLPQPNRDAAFVKGAEIEVCFPDGFRHRFAIYSVRCLEWGVDQYGKHVTEYNVFYRVRDAETVSDAQVREGVRPRVVGEFDTLDKALAAIERHRVPAYA